MLKLTVKRGTLTSPKSYDEVIGYYKTLGEAGNAMKSYNKKHHVNDYWATYKTDREGKFLYSIKDVVK